MRAERRDEAAMVRDLAAVARELGITKVSTPSGYVIELGPAPIERSGAAPVSKDPYDTMVDTLRAQHDTLFASSSVKPPFVPPPRPSSAKVGRR